jgi:beta-glucosidase
VLDVTPVDGRLVYEEGVHVGYRAWLRAGVAPAYAFGHGLGYTTWSFDEISVDAATGAEPGDAVVRVTVTNTGERAGKQVVQVYASRDDSAVDRPVRWLVGFGVVRTAAGETATVEIAVDARRFAHWGDGWELESGAFTLHAGSSVDDLPLETTVSPATAVAAGVPA